ncbi:hypothetical protein [Pseudomonas sp. 2FE]|uniref:hypothetical protein n=1 Tax=Pseudomonas sp. 2FE TaxID=2502190 RepID=UPI0010F51F84|nr:hypothetical protein [Pseudomonas sp. 2FE]
MPGENTPPESTSSTMSDYLTALGGHALRILALRHNGDGLRSIGAKHATGLAGIGISAVLICTLLAPDISGGTGPVGATAVAILAALALRTFGPHAVAGFGIFLLATEPVALLLRHQPMGALLDQMFSLWCLIALSVYGYRCMKSNLEMRQ